MAHAPLLRQNTAPVFQPNTNGFGVKNSMNHAPRASQLSGSTAFAGSTASLSSLASAATMVPQNGGPVLATANIINQKADASRSLYQICVSLKQRLAQVPGFGPYLEQLDPHDPVDPLWHLFRTGYPLLTIYNSLGPTEELKVEDDKASDAKKSKIAIFKFVQACMKELQVPASESFVITDLMGNDTGGFVKVTQVVNYVLDLAEQGGHLLQAEQYPETKAAPAGAQMSYRDHIVKELVDTERKYVQDLENLHDLKTSLEQKGAIPGDTVHQIFLNINAILDFQRRFLIRIESTRAMPDENQRWGSPFVLYEDAFDIYQPFIANQRKAAQIANNVFDKIQLSDHPVAADFNTLDGFLLKPMQRLVKYPLLLKDLNKKSEDDEVKADLVAGCEAAERVLHKANDAVHQDMLDEALEDLINRVDDWKGHKVEQFGKLLLHGIYGVITGKTDQEKDYEIYLFESILLCCKEITQAKSKDKKDKTRSLGPKVRNRTAKLQLKGRIFMTNITDVISLSKPGSHSVQICWKGDPGVENFTIKFLNEEMMKKWAAALEGQRKENAQPRTSAAADSGPTDFVWTGQNMKGLENPFLQQEDDDDDDDYGPATAPAGFPPIQHPGHQLSGFRTASSSNLRQRAGTNDSSGSIAGMVRAPPPRFPLPQPPAPLNLQTQNGAHSPGPWTGGDSYFSPVAESPASSRTSTTSGVFSTPSYGFPKSSTPQPHWDENNRNTAPAMPRAPSRDSTSPNPSTMNGRHPRGPSMPVMASQQSAAQQQRSRSYSTPDINGPGMPRQRQPSQGTIPAVPGIPQHFHSHSGHEHAISRTQTSSPRNELPIRAQTQSPSSQRERMHKHSGSVGGNIHYPGQPHSRQTTPVPAGTPLRVDASAANSRTVSPAMGMAPIPPPSAMASPDFPLPTQLKVRVNTETGNYVTLVVAFNITYQSLIDRIDAKLARFTNSSIGKGLLKLRYHDEDGDFVTIESDDDIQIAFSEWREGFRATHPGGVGEIELFCLGDTS